MRVGDVIINPYVGKEFRGKPNPMYKSMVSHVGSEYTTCLRIDGCKSKYPTKDAMMWDIVGHVDIEKMILECGER